MKPIIFFLQEALSIFNIRNFKLFKKQLKLDTIQKFLENISIRYEIQH